MKRATTLLVALAVGVLAAQSAFAANAVRISQVYGGGGGSGYYQYDYVELFNDSASPVAIGGWSIQYGSATGTSFASSTSNMAILPAGAMIGACGYYLVQVGSAGTAGIPLPVTPDFVNAGGPNISQSTGKLALINNGTGGNLCSGNTVGGIYVDEIGWGSTANCFEGAVGPLLDNGSANVRKGDGTQDTDNNANDFVKTSVNPLFITIHNSQSPQNPGCLVVPVSPNTWGRVKILYR